MGRIFSVFVALLQEGIRLSGVTLPPQLARTEPGNQRQYWGVIRRGQK
jgi:hypothetical protein